MLCSLKGNFRLVKKFQGKQNTNKTPRPSLCDQTAVGEEISPCVEVTEYKNKPWLEHTERFNL